MAARLRFSIIHKYGMSVRGIVLCFCSNILVSNLRHSAEPDPVVPTDREQLLLKTTVLFYIDVFSALYILRKNILYVIVFSSN